MGLFDFFKKDKTPKGAEGSKKKAPPSEQGEEIGKVVGYFAKVKAAVIKITKGSLTVGDEILIVGHTSRFKQKIDSLQIDNQPISEAKKGQVVGVRVKERVRRKDIVYKLS